MGQTCKGTKKEEPNKNKTKKTKKQKKQKNKTRTKKAPILNWAYNRTSQKNNIIVVKNNDQFNKS